MRRKFNRAAVCSSDNYRASRKSHLQFLEKQHSHFTGLLFSGELSIDVPEVDGDGMIKPRFKVIRVFGRDIRVTVEEYNIHCREMFEKV